MEITNREQGWPSIVVTMKSLLCTAFGNAWLEHCVTHVMCTIRAYCDCRCLM